MEKYNGSVYPNISATTRTVKSEVVDIATDFVMDDDTTEVILLINGLQVARMSAHRAARIFSADSRARLGY